jgi:hypothetical protein
MTTHRPPLLLPRPLIFFASLWLVGSWLVSIGFHQPMQPSSQSYTPGVRLMLLCLIIGLLIGWPLLRLSQRRAHYPVRQTFLDIIVLLSTVQVVLWPLRLVTPWSTQRTAIIDATMAGWLLLAAAIVAAAIRTNNHVARVAAMLVCLGLCLAGPTLAWAGVATGVIAEPDRYALISPLTATHRLASEGGAPPRTEDWTTIRWLGATVCIAWCAVLILPRRELHIDTEHRATSGS